MGNLCGSRAKEPNFNDLKLQGSTVDTTRGAGAAAPLDGSATLCAAAEEAATRGAAADSCLTAGLKPTDTPTERNPAHAIDVLKPHAVPTTASLRLEGATAVPGQHPDAAIYVTANAAPMDGSRCIMPHSTLAYRAKEAMVASVWSRGGGDKGQPHDQLMCGAPPPPNEAARAETMRTLKLFSAQPCPEIDVLLGVVNRVMGVSTSIVDLFGGPVDGGAWVCNATQAPVGPSPWQHTVCPWDLLVPHPTLLVVEDLREDARFAHMPLIGYGLRTYVSSPIVASDGHRLGGLCFMDARVIRLDIGQCRMMNNFAEIAVRELERYAEVLPRLKGGEELLVAAYQSSLQPLQRNLASTYDSCIMIVDMSQGFELLYVSHSWLQWSGGQDRLVAMGQVLPDLLETVTSMAISWATHANDAKAGARFVVPRVRAAGAPPSSPVFDISFRCGALEPLDNDTLPVEIPTSVPLSTSMGGIYIGRLHVLHDSAALRYPLETAGQVSTQAITAQAMAVKVIPGLKVGQFLARGGYGTAYLAEWHDTQVVCKVQDHMLLNEGERASAESEIALGQELVHPHVVRTLAHGTIQLQQRAPPAGEDNSGVASWDEHISSDEYDWMSDLEPGRASVPGGCKPLHTIDMAAIFKSTAGTGDAGPASTDEEVAACRADSHPSPRASSSGSSGSSGSCSDAALALPGTWDSSLGLPAASWHGLKQNGSNSGSKLPMARLGSSGRTESVELVTADSAQSNKTYPLELRVFLVLEFCDQGVLQDAIDRGWLRKQRHCTAAPVPCLVLRTALDIAEAMKYLHSKKIIHGDLTGFNVLLKSQSSDAKLRGLPAGSAPAEDQYGRCFTCKVADFGTSRRLPTAQEYIRTESYATVTHMPPEMLKTNSMGLACDVWAFGVLLWSMWTGSRPWAGMSHAQIMAVVIDNTATLQWPCDTPPALAALGGKCLSYRAASRPSFRHICRELRRLLAEEWAVEVSLKSAGGL